MINVHPELTDTTHNKWPCVPEWYALESSGSQAQMLFWTGGDWSSHIFRATPKRKIYALIQILDPSRLIEHEQNGNRDYCISPDDLRLDPRFLNSAYRLLEGVLCGRDSHHHSNLLVQLVENMCDWFHWCVQLQGLSFNAGFGWWVSSSL